MSLVHAFEKAIKSSKSSLTNKVADRIKTLQARVDENKPHAPDQKPDKKVDPLSKKS